MQLCRFAFLRRAFAQSPLIAASVSALAAALFASGYLSQREEMIMRVAEPVGVIAAARDIMAGEALDESKLKQIEVPRRYAEPGAIAAMNDAVARVAAVPIKAGSQLTRAVARLPRDGFGLAGLIPAGRRAFSIALPSSRSAAGLIRPGDSVDLLATFDLGSEASVRRTTIEVVSSAQVLAVNQRMTGAEEASGEGQSKSGLFSQSLPARSRQDEVMVTLAVNSAEAQALAFSQESAALAVALRPTGEESGEEHPQPTTISTIAGGNSELVLTRKGFREYKGR